MNYGDKDPYLNHCIVLNSCDNISVSNSQIEINLEDFKSDTLVLSVSNQCYSVQDTVFYTVYFFIYKYFSPKKA